MSIATGGQSSSTAGTGPVPSQFDQNTDGPLQWERRENVAILHLDKAAVLCYDSLEIL